MVNCTKMYIDESFMEGVVCILDGIIELNPNRATLKSLRERIREEYGK